MADSDKNMNIGINLQTTKSGGDAAQELKKLISALKDLEQNVAKENKEQDKGTEAKKKAGKSANDLKGAIQGLAFQFPILGRLARRALNPFSVLIAAVGIGFRTATEYLRKWNEEMDAAGEAATKALGPTADKLRELKLETIKANEAFQDYQKQFAEESQKIIADIESQIAAMREMLKTQEALTIAAGGDATETRKRFAVLEGELDLRGKSQIIAAKEAQLAEVTANATRSQAVARAGLGGASEAAAKTSLATIPDTIAVVADMIARAEADAAKLPAKVMRNKENLTPLDRILGNYSESVDNPAVAEAQQRIAGMRRYQSSLQQERMSLTGGLAAAAEAETFGTQGRGLAAEIARLRMGEQAAGTGLRAAKVSPLIEQFTAGGGRFEGATGDQFASKVAELAASKMQLEQLLRIVTNIFKDGVVSNSEFRALEQAVRNNQQRINRMPANG